MPSSDFDLLRALDPDPRSKSTVDVQRAITDARRKRAVRGAGYAGTAALTAVAIAGVAIALNPGTKADPTATATGKATATATAPKVVPPSRCTVEKLPAPKGAPMAIIGGADPAGRYFVGRSYPKGGGYQAVIWHDGVGKEVPIPGDDGEEDLRDVNASGTAVGYGYITATRSVPYVYIDGKATRLPGAERGSAYAINDKGQIVGDDEEHPLLWESATAQPRRLPVPAGSTSVLVVDIDEDGTVIGTIDNRQPYIWPANGTPHALPLPALDSENVEARVRYIRDGWVSGVANIGGAKMKSPQGRAGAQIHTVRWNLRTDEVFVDEIESSADAMNALGWQTFVAKKGGARLFADGKVIRLPGLAPLGDDALADIANTLSDDGRTIGGQSNDANGVIQPVVWHCK
ncbi:hypothetical protein [Actinoplanes regularis]|uniref:hypothetical protein n=1 Tax=Actinoplanes regularis TaxID=52697 RepID=UPI0024A3CE64|nr:hypothetical protein [Actinoplanes regularis]GLW33468.1 hypothetical protein Areg01_64060 [Actinoplanes regularis]